MQRTFIDTNILVYADDLDAGNKRERARDRLRDLIRTGQGVISTQVLQEFFSVTTRKLGVRPDIARRKLELLARMDVVTIDPDIILAAVDLHRLHPISFWDALILRAASVAGCTTLLTEDMSSGAVIDGVRIEDPFAGT